MTIYLCFCSIATSVLSHCFLVLKQEPSFTDVSVSLEAQSNNLSASSSGFKSSGLSSNDDDYSYQENPGASGSESGMYLDTSFQCIRFQAFQQTMWHTLWDHNLKELWVADHLHKKKTWKFSNLESRNISFFFMNILKALFCLTVLMNSCGYTYRNYPLLLANSKDSLSKSCWLEAHKVWLKPNFDSTQGTNRSIKIFSVITAPVERLN